MRKSVPCWAQRWGAQARLAGDRKGTAAWPCWKQKEKWGSQRHTQGSSRKGPAEAPGLWGTFRNSKQVLGKDLLCFLFTPAEQCRPLCFRARLLWLILKNEVSR